MVKSSVSLTMGGYMDPTLTRAEYPPLLFIQHSPSEIEAVGAARWRQHTLGKDLNLKVPALATRGPDSTPDRVMKITEQRGNTGSNLVLTPAPPSKASPPIKLMTVIIP